MFELGITITPLVLLWIAMGAVLDVSYWLVLLLAIPAGGFLVRLFMLQHDCSHDAFFRNRFANLWVGRILGIATLTPFDLWRRTHASHHASSGNLDRRGIGDVDTLTVAEYLGRSRWGRLRYRLYRHPVVMFGLGPAYLFLLQHRLPVGVPSQSAWAGVMATNMAIAASAFGLSWLVGPRSFLLIHTPIALIAASVGVWLFYVQHQFEDTHWDRSADWSHPDAALHGSSYYVLPPPLQWLTANIGIHHVHHLCSRIPYYRLPQVLRDHPELAETGRLTLMESFGCVRLALWDEATRKLISFNDLRLQLASTSVSQGNR